MVTDSRLRSNNKQKKYALLSVYNKTGIVEFAETLQKSGYQIISTGGTAKVLTENKINVIPIQEITGNPESFNGRMKTISFQIESGILFDRSKKTHQREAKDLKIKPIDIVVCNLYPFEETVSKKNVKLDDAIENIDVGGPTMIRSAAKNFKHVLVVTDPDDYQIVSLSLEKRRSSQKSPLPKGEDQAFGSEAQARRGEGHNFEDLKKHLAAKAFSHLSFYDSQIASFLRNTVIASETKQSLPAGRQVNEITTPPARDDNYFPTEITLPGRKLMDLRYGENPHQQGAVYITPNTNSPFGSLVKHWGRDLSLTNLTDINAGLESVRMFTEPAAVVIKHNSPCGIALGSSIDQALQRAIDSDPESAFGGVIVLNKPLTIKTAKVIEKFKKDGRGNFDIIASESIDTKTLDFLTKIRKSMGIYTFGHPELDSGSTRHSGPVQNQIPKHVRDYKLLTLKWIYGGFILQTSDDDIDNQFKDWKVVTKKKPTKKQLEQMRIAWKFISRIKSNSIIIVDKDLPMTRGIGSGQTSRIRSTKIAFDQAGKHTKDAIMASDSFFPFDDSVKLANQHSIGAIIQQGGSVNDQMSIDAANKAGIPMVFTGYRAFWH